MIPSTPNIDNAAKISANNKFSSKLSWKRKESLQFATEIKEFFSSIGIVLPATRREFETKTYYKFVDPETGEMLEDTFQEHFELAKLYYNLKKCNKAVYNLFEKPKNVDHSANYLTQVFSCWYSKHRLDPVWNWRKSQIIRKIWKDFLIDSKIHEKYDPYHLVLTVPHTNGVWEGRRFYAKEIIEKFNHLRKSSEWKRKIYGGEYGIEISKKGHGFHIHIHVLIFQKRNYTRNQVEQFVKRQWSQLTGASFIHYESLYVHKKDDSGQYVMYLKRAGKYMYNEDTGKEETIIEPVLVRKKYYLNEGWVQSLDPEEKLNTYVSGVMECIKYHFKQDSLKTDSGYYNIELISEILQNTKNLRMYSKFGAFYKEKSLNYSRIEKDEPEYVVEEEKEEESEESENDELNGSLSNVEIINPFTNEPAQEGEYITCISIPESLKHNSRSGKNPFQPQVLNRDMFFEVMPGLDPGDMMKSLATNKYSRILVHSEYERYIRSFTGYNRQGNYRYYNKLKHLHEYRV